MIYFPVTNSQLSASHLGSFIQQKYSLHAPTKCQLIKAGINDSYLVSDDFNKFVFRVYSLDWRSEEEIGQEIELLSILKDKGIDVSYAIPDSSGNYIQEFQAPEGKRYAVLFSYANGEKRQNSTTEVHFQIGQLIARMHKITSALTIQRIDYSSKVLLSDSLLKISEFLSEDSEEMKFLKSTQALIFDELEKANTDELRKGVVHLDIWFDNLNITEQNQITLFDFDFCGNGWLCLDIAYYIVQLHNVEKYERDNIEPKVNAFLNGYETIVPISAEEKRLLPILGISLYFFYLGVQCQRYENWSNSFLSENYLKRYINQIVKKYYSSTIA